MSTEPAPAAAPISNSPFVAPVPPAQVAADAATARQNAEVVRPDLAEARRRADQNPHERYFETVRRDQGWPEGEQLGTRKLSDSEYSRLTYSEKIEYSERRSALANKGPDDRTNPQDPTKPAEPAQDRIKITDDFWATPDEARGLAERAALEASRKATLPQDANGYEPKLPKDFRPPQGIEYKIDANNPVLAQAKQLMHDIDSGKVYGQAAFERMLSLHAANEISQLESLKAARDAEVTKLGAAGHARITAIDRFLNAQLGSDIRDSFMSTLVTERHVRGWEQIMQKFGASGSSFSSARQSSEPPRMSDAQWNKMSYSEQKSYAAGASAAREGRR